MTREDTSFDASQLGETILEALDHAGIGVTIIGERAGKLERLFINAAGARALGYAPDEINEIPPLNVLAPAERERIGAMVGTDERPPLLETEVIAKDGRRIPLEVGLANTERDGTRLIVAFLRDITRREEVQAALRQSEARFRHLAEAAPDVIVVISRGRFLYANPAAARALRLSSVEEFLRLEPKDFLPAEELGAMMARIRKVREGERLTPREYRGVRRDGSSIMLEISSLAVEFEGQPAVLAYGRDVTERKALQARLAQHDRLAAVGTLAAGIAHEVNNPMTYVLLHLEQLRRSLPSLVPEEHHERILGYVSEALEGGERVRVIVRDLLEFARPRGPERRLSDIADVCEAAIKLARPTVERHARLSTDLPRGIFARTNAAKLGQVVLNLLVNGSQAVAERGSEGEVRLRVYESESSVVIEVSDDGPGVPPEHLDQIFTPFFTTKGVGGGTGLGLAICHAIVESLGGTIAAENRAPRGARFRVELPVEVDSERAAPSVSERSPEPLSRLSIAIIDDEAAVARALERTLEHDHSVSVHLNPSEALEALSAGTVQFDLVLCDVLMPELRGDELYRRLCERHAHYQSRFVFMTGGALPPEAQELVSNKAITLLLKPFETQDLVEAIAKQLRRDRAARSRQAPPRGT